MYLYKLISPPSSHNDLKMVFYAYFYINNLTEASKPHTNNQLMQSEYNIKKIKVSIRIFGINPKHRLT